MPKRGLKTLIIAAAVLLLHLGLLLFLRMNPPQVAEVTAPLMAVEMVQLAPEPQPQHEPIPTPPEPVKPVEKNAAAGDGEGGNKPAEGGKAQAAPGA